MTEEPLTEDLNLQAPDKDARMWAMFTHLGAFACFTAIPFANILVPLVIWLMKREESPFIDAHGKESLNFQISAFIYAILPMLLSLILIGIPFLLALVVFWFAVVIIAALKANNGEPYRYPLCIRFIK